ncbi:tetratricopeptide repeat protein 1 [Oryzias melastigma]|uniref:Tetratricopeptide repeat protein 1 n=1 Tax=Oryzias melastigma TaxID=30732 RepID=A0A3B3DFT9_ORYME|nr:tetratricopeptide repeat protein 1 [Oryzias melastigma]XP_024122552.1 tetratricopeptide repeat protein 1 [Oryzias melastigma]
MSSREGGESRVQEEDFYDCPETLEECEEQRRKTPIPAEESDPGVEAETHRGNEENDREEGKESAELEDSDSELKEEVCRGAEFDDDYLREVEKELTEEEKESRRQESLTLKETGNSQFKAKNWSEAEDSYSKALALCPVCYSRERAVLFSNRAAARLHLDMKDQAISDCSRAIDLDPDYLRALLRRAELYEQTEKLDEALEDYKKVLERDPSHSGARQACVRLPPLIQERNEKLKEEMISKLKDLGNMVLRPFGLSTNNFQVNQDPNSGSYSINFVQAPNNNK